ncbi:MAG: CNNM domain-containing protein, partial [Alistipes sp.]
MDTFLGITFNGISPHVVVMGAIALLLLLVSALVSGAETAFFSLSNSDIQRIKKHNTASAAAMLTLLKNVDVLLATILVV